MFPQRGGDESGQQVDNSVAYQVGGEFGRDNAEFVVSGILKAQLPCGDGTPDHVVGGYV